METNMCGLFTLLTYPQRFFFDDYQDEFKDGMMVAVVLE